MEGTQVRVRGKSEEECEEGFGAVILRNNSGKAGVVVQTRILMQCLVLSKASGFQLHRLHRI